jgi:hypothetical protein
MSDEKDAKTDSIPTTTLPDFLEGVPPNQHFKISDLYEIQYATGGKPYCRFRTPEIQLHCTHESCNGLRFFRSTEPGPAIPEGYFKFFFITYKCSNCQEIKKTFSLGAFIDSEAPELCLCFKLGEFPPFGPQTPSRLIKLIGPDREHFLSGRRCENQGLGIGAFAYYRRVVENQKNRILKEIIKVAKKINTPEESITELEDAVNEIQFSKALSMVKNGIPQSLLLDGHNPLSLLHSALSEGLHDKSDTECLEIATSVRVILSELSERLSQALKDEAELNQALKTLMDLKK